MILRYCKIIQFCVKYFKSKIEKAYLEITKVPNELYKSDDYSLFNTIQITNEILANINKDLSNLDLFSILKENLKNPKLNFEKFMTYPDINYILTEFTNRLFNIFAGINNLYDIGIFNYREQIIESFDKIKSEHKDNNLFGLLLSFFEKFLSLLNNNLKLPIDKTIDLKIEIEETITIKIKDIISKCNSVMNDLLNYFRSSGLLNYMENDKDYKDKYINNFIIDWEKTNYFIPGDNLASDVEKNVEEDIYSNLSLNLEQKDVYHIKFKFVENIFKKNNEENILLGRRRTRSEIFEIDHKEEIVKKIIPFNHVKESNISDINKNLFKSQLKKNEGRLKFTAKKIKFVSE